ncbi:MAG: glycosyltransferase family 4 protein [Polyangiaceae bacterium]
MKILFITRVISPFQIELGQALRELGHDAHILFSTGDTGTRPKHWNGTLESWTHAVNIENNPLRLVPFIDNLRPGAIVYGGYRGFPLPLAKRLAKQRGIHLGFWLEKPLPTTTFRQVIRDVVVREVLSGASFVWPIGPEALRTYSQFVDERSQLHVVPYGEDLSKNLRFDRRYPKAGEPVRFLFSGKYQHRNNIWELLSAFRTIRQRYLDRAELVLSGYAGMDHEVRRYVAEDEILRPAVRHDVEFETWDDRLRPFRESDVLAMPGTHAGWGLIVPEALSLGMPVIAGRGMESAEMLVDDSCGRLVGASAYQIVDALALYLDHPELIAKHGAKARQRAKVCDACAIGERMVELLASLPPA